MAIIYWKYKINNPYSLESLMKNYIGWYLWFNKFTPLEEGIYPHG